MNASAPLTANEFIDEQLTSRLKLVEEAFDADALCLVAPMTYGIDDFTRALIEERHQHGDRQERCVVLLTTVGGYIEIVQRIVDTLRHHYDHVSFVIPNSAYSAGTVLAMSGDEIYMDYYARLGPIDPQVENSSGKRVPALGYLKQWERLLKKAKRGNLTMAELQLMIEGFDQAALYQYEQARELSITLLKEWLAKYKFKNWVTTEGRNKTVTPAMRQRRALEIAKQLNDTDRWHSHGHGISRDILESELNLRIQDLDVDRARRDPVQVYYRLLEDYMGRRGHFAVLHTICKYQPVITRYGE